MWTLIVTGISLGFSAGTSCAVVCFPVLIPYLASQENTRMLSGLKTVLLFSAGRLAAYMALGLLLALVLRAVDTSVLTPVATIILSIILIVHGLNTLAAFEYNQKPVVRVCRRISVNRPHFVMGLMVGLRPCLPLIAALMYTVNLISIFDVVIYMLFFGIGSSLLVVVLGVAGRGLINLLVKRIELERIRRLSGLVLVILGGFFLLQGIGGMINL